MDAELNTKNKVQTTGSMAVSVLRHSSGTLNWRPEELQKLGSKLLTFHKKHHPKAYVDRWYVVRKEGGRGLMQLEEAYVVQVPKLMEYVDRKKVQRYKLLDCTGTAHTGQCDSRLQASGQNYRGAQDK